MAKAPSHAEEEQRGRKRGGCGGLLPHSLWHLPLPNNRTFVSPDESVPQESFNDAFKGLLYSFHLEYSFLTLEGEKGKKKLIKQSPNAEH